MHEHDFNRVVFHSKEDMAGGIHLRKAESILKADVKSDYSDINDVLELYNIKKYIDNELFLEDWTTESITNFKLKVLEFDGIIGRFMSNINDANFKEYHQETNREYVKSFWELVNNQSIFKRISKPKFSEILACEPHEIHVLLTQKKIVDYYNAELREFLLSYAQSAEILLSVYEVERDLNSMISFIPKSLTIEDKENIVVGYIGSDNVNLNYLELIQNAKHRNDFRISDKTRLKAKRLHESEVEKFFADKGGMLFGVSVGFREKTEKIKDGYTDDKNNINYTYSLDFIKKHKDPYSLYFNFKTLFEYIDRQNRINFVSKGSQLGLFEKIMGVRSQNEYRVGTSFRLSEMSSQAQIVGYSKIINKELDVSLEDIFHHVLTTDLPEKYNLTNNIRFSISSASSSYLEKVRNLAPEFESILKQYKLFVEEGTIDHELLQMSSSPSGIKAIPSLNENKYLYFNEENEELVGCSNLFFSDQTLLAYVEPFKEKHYGTLFDLLANEAVKYSFYESHQTPKIDYLISKGFLSIDDSDFIQVSNPVRLTILKDLRDNEVSSFHHFSADFRSEAEQMATEDIVFFESSLFSLPEQAYLNYFLNKSEFTNGLDLRNSYLHGTQANSDDVQKHEYAYFTYLKLLFLMLLKIEDDLVLSKIIESRE